MSGLETHIKAHYEQNNPAKQTYLLQNWRDWTS